MPLPPPGTFRLYPFAEPPLAAGRYTLTSEVSGLPGPVDPLATIVDVVAPRYALPPDQLLGTFPPAGARGSFTSRLPQVVLRRRTLPWERSPDLEAEGTPTPWLALVLLAEGEGELHTDVPVEQCVTSGVSLGADRDVPKAACIEVPESVVKAIFPTREDLAMLTHVREVDMRDTELALGDDDGWMAVVLANRLPQPNTRYLACLISVEGQYPKLPEVSDVQLELEYDRLIQVADVRVVANAAAAGSAVPLDRLLMGLPTAADLAQAGGQIAGAAAVPTSPAGPAVRSAVGKAAPTGSGWAATTGQVGGANQAPQAAAVGASIGSKAHGAQVGKLALADGFSYPIALLRERTLRFPVLAYWSFTCEERGDFQYLAEHVTSRLLGHVAEPGVVETPDGDPIPAGGAEPPGARAEPPKSRPLPLVTETGHLALDAVTRRGDATQAWFRGPLAPTPVERATARPDGDERPPLAHHADQLRRVVPDGREDLSYASAFEMGRMLALSQPGVAAALRRWRQDAFGAARVRAASTEAVAAAPAELRRMIERPDPLTDDIPERVRAAGVGRRTGRALFELLGEDPEAIAPSRPLADGGAAAAEVREMLNRGRDSTLVRGLGIEASLGPLDVQDRVSVADALNAAPAIVSGARDLSADISTLRLALEAEAARLTEAAATLQQAADGRFAPPGGLR
jgi:hypothetical protein